MADDGFGILNERGKKMKKARLCEMESAKEKCPRCGRENESRSIMDGCFSFWCESCKKAYEGCIVDIADFTVGEMKNYTV